MAAAALLVLAVAAAGAGTDERDNLAQEALVMQGIRQALAGAGSLPAALEGWSAPSDALHQCSWSYITCDEGQRIVKVMLLSGFPARAASRDMVAVASALHGLARLRQLADLGLGRIFGAPLPSSLLQAWVQPGAFPRLLRLRLDCAWEGPLPDIRPGALPQLQALSLGLDELHASLPPSWGADPATLPSLQQLAIQVQVGGPLPRQWASGFRSLRRLSIRDTSGFVEGSSPPAAGSSAAAAGPPPPPPPPPVLKHPLPPEWARSFPRLARLAIADLPMAGSLPEAWAAGGFPALSTLSLANLSLTGTLPPYLFLSHPELKVLRLQDNQLAGTLPADWAASEVQELIARGNRLAGPAFPPDWLLPGSLLGLRVLLLGGNPGLTGTLPASLDWPILTDLGLNGTAVTGAVPDSWCQAPFAATLTHLSGIGTAADASLPPCVAHDMPRLDLEPRLGASAGNLTRTPHSHSRSAAALSLAALLPLAAAAAAGAAVRVLWRRRRRRLRSQRANDGEALLQMGSAELGLQADAWPGGRPALNRRLRLAALVRAESNGNIEMLPLAGLPAALAHQLASGQGSAAAGSMASQEWEAEHSSLPGLEAESLLPGGDAGAGAGAGPALSTGRGSSGDSSGRSSSGMPPDCGRRWGLETASLQLQLGALEFVADADGQLVELGEGGHAVVYLARLQGVEVAVKVTELLSGVESQSIWRETALLRRCIHERIVPLYGVALKGCLLMLAMRLMEGGSLRAALQDEGRRERLHWAQGGCQVAADVAQALDHLHRQLGIMHGDLSSGNVLLDGGLRGHLGDLGLAFSVASAAPGGGARGFCLTHAAPEQVLGERCTSAADMYSYGVLLVELTTRQAVHRRGTWHLPHAPEECPQGVLALIEACLSHAPRARPTAAEALQRLRQLEWGGAC